MRAWGSRAARVRRMRRDQSGCSATQRPVVRGALISYALEADGVPPLTERLSGPAALTGAAGILHLCTSARLHVCNQNKFVLEAPENNRQG